MPISVTVTGASAYTTPPGPPYAGHAYVPPASPTYIPRVVYDGIDITSLVMYADAEFTSSVNGAPGTCRFRVRDDFHQFTFTPGHPITLSINGVTEWTGFVSKVSRQHAFPYGPASQTRFLIIDGVDINILFRKRVVFKKSKPRDVEGKTYHYSGTPTKDTTAIADLIAGWLDLTKDGINTTTKVANVGNINVDQDANPFAGGWTWEQAMASINTLPAAVFYINPNKQLVWADVDVATAPFALSDTPNNSTSYGYRELEILADAANLINDYLAWGAGAGSDHVVFSRVTDSASVTEHGTWQASTFVTDVYKQSTINRVANAFVYGSPSSKRGHKDDRIGVTCTTFRQGLQAGMGVNFTCGAFGFTDVLPVRQVRITFPTPTNPRYDLLLSHEIDAVFSFYDVYHPKATQPRSSHIGKSTAITSGGCVADDFNRTVIGGWGDGGLGSWATGNTYNATPSVNGSAAVMSLGLSGYQGQVVTSTVWNSDFDMTARVTLGDSVSLNIGFGSSSYAGEVLTVSLGRVRTGGIRYFQVYGYSSSDARYFISTTYNAPSSVGWYIIRLRRVGSQYSAKVWIDGQAEPGWQAWATDLNSALLNGAMTVGFTEAATTSAQGSIDYINFCPIDSATAGSEEFTRVVATGWGSGSLGGWGFLGSGATYSSVDGSAAVVSTPSGAYYQVFPYLSGINSIWSLDFDMTTRFYVDTTRPFSYTWQFSEETKLFGFTFLMYYFDETNPTGPTSHLSLNDTSGLIFSNEYSIPYVAQGWYQARLARYGSSYYAKVWPDGSEPGWQMTLAAPVGYATKLFDTLELGMYSTEIGLAGYGKFDYLRFDGSSSSLAGDSSGGSTSYGVTVTEPGDIRGIYKTTGTSLNLGGPYFKGTTKLFKNGRILRLGTDYTENPSSGTVTLTTALTASDTVTATFLAADKTNGGVSRRML